jgi:hypothetical protein
MPNMISAFAAVYAFSIAMLLLASSMVIVTLWIEVIWPLVKSFVVDTATGVVAVLVWIRQAARALLAKALVFVCAGHRAFACTGLPKCVESLWFSANPTYTLQQRNEWSADEDRQSAFLNGLQFRGFNDSSSESVPMNPPANYSVRWDFADESAMIRHSSSKANKANDRWEIWYGNVSTSHDKPTTINFDPIGLNRQRCFQKSEEEIQDALDTVSMIYSNVERNQAEYWEQGESACNLSADELRELQDDVTRFEETYNQTTATFAMGSRPKKDSFVWRRPAPKQQISFYRNTREPLRRVLLPHGDKAS